MHTRTLGPDGLKVSAIGFGGRRLSDPHTATCEDEDAARAVIDRAIELGCTFFDSASSYADGKNEELFGRLLKGRREQVVIATKFGIVRLPEGGRAVCGRPDWTMESCEAALKRLDTDVIDLFYLHRVDPDVPIEETVGAMANLKEQGKIRYIGLSEAGPETLRRACKVHQVAALQSEYSLWTRDYEADTLPACKELGIGFVPYYPLGRGFLAGAVRTIEELGPKDGRRRAIRLQPENIRRNLELLAQLMDLADEKGCKVGQLALAWILRKGPDYVPIPGTTRIAHLEDNLAAADIALTPEDMARIEALFPPRVAAGARVGAAALAELNR